MSLYNDLKPSCLARSNLNDDMPLPSLEQESSIPTSLSQDLAPHTSSAKGITKDVVVSSNPPALFHHSREFEEGEDLKSASELI